MKKLLMLLLSVVLAFSAVACGERGNGGGDDGSTSVFKIITTDTGTGSDGIEALAKKFEQKFAGKSYGKNSKGEDKKGVKVSVKIEYQTLDLNRIEQDGYHAYINPYQISQNEIGKGVILNIDDIIKNELIPGENVTIESKIPEDYRDDLQGTYKSESGYYLAPGVNYAGGLTYNKYLYDDMGFYFVSPENYGAAKEESSLILGRESYFADVSSSEYETAIDADADWNGWNSNRYLSCGPDGVYGTYDDGMASSLEELVALCEYMDVNGVYPFVLSDVNQGGLAYSSDAMINALLCDVGDEANENNWGVMTNLQSDKLEVVTGYTKDTLWGMSKTKVPTTAIVPINEKQGYLTTWSAARYYTTAFWKLAVDEGWFADAKNLDNEETARDFIFSGRVSGYKKIAMLCDGSFWNNESQECNNYVFYDAEKTGISSLDREKELKWLSLPRQIDGTVTEGNGTKEPFLYLEMYTNNLFNAKFKDDPEIMEIVKDWLLFFYSDENLQYITASTGCPIAMNYDYNLESDLYKNEPFYKDYFTRQTQYGKVVYLRSENRVFKAQSQILADLGTESVWTGVGLAHKSTFYQAFKTLSYTVQQAFEENMITMRSESYGKGNWAAIYGSVQDGGEESNEQPTNVDINGNSVVYAK